MTATTERAGPAAPPGILSGAFRATTVGIVIVVTLVAFEAMAVATAMPFAVRDLHGMAYYSWPFTAFLVTSVVGIVVAGDIADRVGAARPLLAGLAVFTAGLLVAGFAPAMAIFVAGRAVQGLGAGMIVVALYVVIAHSYAEALRPKVFAALSAAWVLPSVLGPTLSGQLTEHLSWRWVFLGLPPFIVLGTLLLAPALRRLPVRAAGRRRAGFRVLLAVAVAAGVALLQVAGQGLRWLSVVPAVVGAVLLVAALPRLLPAGTPRMRRGLPAVVAFRGLLAGAFFGADAFLPLNLTAVHGFRASEAGIPLTLAALGWSAGAWWQGRQGTEERYRLLRAGFVAVAAGLLGLAVVAGPAFSGWLTAPIWVLGGLGMGLAMPTISFLALHLAPDGGEGVTSSALQISDVLCSSVCIGIAGVVLAAVIRGGGRISSAVTLINVLLAIVAVGGALAAGRARVARG